MSTPLVVSNTIVINAPAARVWDILTNPTETKKYMFGCETVSDWNTGSPLLWKGTYEGKEMVFVKGNIVELRKHELLKYTTFDPNSSMKDVPENYLTVTYRLTPENGKTTLFVSQGDFATVAEGQKRYNEVNNNGEGWNPILVEIKKIAEASQ